MAQIKLLILHLLVLLKLNNMKKKNLKFGFTMVEIVVAIAILAIGVVGVSYFFARSTQVTRTASNTSVAANLGQGVIDEELVKSYNELNVATGTKTRFSNDTSSPFYNFQKQINVSLIDQDLNGSAADVGLKKIDVFIFWTEGGSEKQLELATIKAR